MTLKNKQSLNTHTTHTYDCVLSVYYRGLVLIGKQKKPILFTAWQPIPADMRHDPQT